MSRRAKNVVVIFVAEVTLTLFDERAGLSNPYSRNRDSPYPFVINDIQGRCKANAGVTQGECRVTTETNPSLLQSHFAACNPVLCGAQTE